MPLIDGEETRDAFVDAVVALGDERMGWVGSIDSIPFIGGSGGMYTAVG